MKAILKLQWNCMDAILTCFGNSRLNVLVKTLVCRKSIVALFKFKVSSIHPAIHAIKAQASTFDLNVTPLDLYVALTSAFSALSQSSDTNGGCIVLPIASQSWQAFSGLWKPAGKDKSPRQRLKLC